MRTTDLLRGEQEKQVKNPDSYYRAAVSFQRVEAELSSNGRTFFCADMAPMTFSSRAASQPRGHAE